ncbi:site-specific integrase [Azospirillum brasilense]|uniref:site-specific integrase n=1 Tax=Azospirillum brasilense TaxID=192 RepID=UPI001FFE7334|nr:site-specific integrase [Azospirillum brasilense]
MVDAVLALLGEVMQAGTIDTSALRALLQPILLGELERAEVARALGGERGPEEIARRVQAELDAVATIEDAVRHNRLDAARTVLERAVTVGLPVPAAETAEHSYLARLVLRGLPRVHLINAEREQNHYDDDLEDVLPPLPASSMPAGAPSGNAVPGAGGRPAIVLAPQAPVPTVMPAQVAAQPPSAAAPVASIDPVEPCASPVPNRKEVEAHPHSQATQPAVAAAASVLVTTSTAAAPTSPIGPAATVVDRTPEATVAEARPQPQKASPAKDWTIQQAMGEWVCRRQRDTNPFKTASLCKEEERNYRVAAELFTSLIGDRRAVEVTEEDLLRFRGELHRVPNLFGRGTYRNMTGAEAVARADAVTASQQAAVMARAEDGQIDRDNLAHEMRDAEVPRLSMKTVNKHLDKIKGLLRWLRTTMKVAIDRDLLDLKIRYDQKDIGRAANADREAFLSADLRKLFASPCWTGCAGIDYRHRPGSSTVKDAKFWIPLLAALEGVRLGEAAQLLTTDIQLRCFDQEDFTDWDVDLDNPSGPWPRLRRFSPKDADGVPTVGIWCIDVIPEDGKSVKTPSSKRIIPIHPLLLELGFLDYVDAQKRAGKRDLFPGLRPEKATRAGENLGEWFSRYLEYIGMKRERLSFHSFRHSFDTHLFNREVPDVRVSELMGHAQHGQTRNRYYKGARLAKLTEAIASINYRLHTAMVDGQLCLVLPPGA